MQHYIEEKICVLSEYTMRKAGSSALCPTSLSKLEGVKRSLYYASWEGMLVWVENGKAVGEGERKITF